MATEAILQALTQNIFTALLNQAQFALDFRDQLESMKTKLELMQAFLSSIDNLKSREKDLQKFLPNMRKLIYEADDILTDCLVRDEYQVERTCWSFSPHGLLFQYKIRNKLSQINSRIQKMETSIGVYLRPQQPINQGSTTYRVIGYSSQDYEPAEITGLENDMEKIKGWIFSSNEEFNRVGIVGMGGLGKTTIAQKIFNDRDIGAQFEKRIWLSISQNFNEDRIMRAILKQLGQDDSTLDESHLLRRIHQILFDKTWLIIMDDVWRMNLDWWTQLWPTSKRSFIIITSRGEDVTKSMGVDISRIHRPKILNEQESWSLFSKYAFSTRGGKCPNDQFERVGRDVLQKCGGLPLAIKTIGALLAQKHHSLAEWKKTKDNFLELLTTEGNNSEVMTSLQLSYYELPSLLKQCLLCFSIYPEDSEINGEQIVNWWVGEGLIQGQVTKTAMELGFQYLSDLVNRCLVEVVQRRGYDGKVYSCKMHDLVRDMTIKIAKYEAFCDFDEQGRQKLCEDSRWLGFTGDIDLKSLKISSKLRAFLLMSSTPVSLDKNVAFLMSLRVLDISCMKVDKIKVENLWNWICSLKRLANLSLSGFSGLKEVSSSIQKLQNLQILVLRKCNNLAKIHPSITNLKRLIILDLASCPLKNLPHALGKLVHLQELSGFKVVNHANTQSCQFLELLKLMELRVLRMIIDSESEISENEWNVLSQLKKLKVLAIDAEDCTDKEVPEMLNHLSPPPRLEELYLRRYRHETLPKWMNPKELSNLQYLCLEDGDIINFETSPESQHSNGSKWILEGICLKFMSNLVLDWKILENDIPFLCYAEVSHCFNLKNFPYPSDKPAVWRKIQD